MLWSGSGVAEGVRGANRGGRKNEVNGGAVGNGGALKKLGESGGDRGSKGKSGGKPGGISGGLLGGKLL